MRARRLPSLRERLREQARRCPICGALSVVERRCKRLCTRCGYQECCADACLIEYLDESPSQAAKPAENTASRG